LAVHRVRAKQIQQRMRLFNYLHTTGNEQPAFILLPSRM
jgi:hypothetical protein